jgi:RNA polymerase sigma-70 factor (ECF subfamily)
MSGRISADDVLQQAYLQAFRSLPTFTPCSEHAFYAWLETIAENVLTDAGKKKQPWQVPPSSSDSSNSSYMGLLSRIMDDDATPVTESMGRELLRALHVALASLPEDCRKAIQLRYLEGSPRKEVAERMGCTESKVHHLCDKGRAILRGELQRLSRFI